MPEKLYFVSLRRAEALSASPTARKSICFSIDNELVGFARPVVTGRFAHAKPSYHRVFRCPHRKKPRPPQARQLTPPLASLQIYEPFFADFGPLNLGQAYRFCEKTSAMLKVRHPSAASQPRYVAMERAGGRAASNRLWISVLLGTDIPCHVCPAV